MKKFIILSLVLLAAWGMPAGAGERVDLVFTNNLNEEIVDIRVKYATPYDEPRYYSSRVTLSPGAEGWRLGVQGTTLPEHIIIDLATKSYDFADLSGLDPSNDMFLEVAHEDGHPILRRADGDSDAVIQGEEHDYLTTANRPNAVDRDFLTNVTTGEEVVELIVETVSDAKENMGESETVDIEAGPIWNNDHAQTRCPEVVAEWSEENGRSARWNGHWSTTVPGAMSVCGGAAGTVDLEETVFSEDDGWGETVCFPVFWKDWVGVAKVRAMDGDNEDEGIGFELRFRIPENGVAEMVDSLLDDLRVDGFRPWRFAIHTWNVETDEGVEADLVFHEGEGDKCDHQDALQERLFAAYADNSLVEASATWVKEEAFDVLQAGEEPEPAQGVMVMFSRGTFAALFIPNGRTLME